MPLLSRASVFRSTHISVNIRRLKVKTKHCHLLDCDWLYFIDMYFAGFVSRVSIRVCTCWGSRSGMVTFLSANCFPFKKILCSFVMSSPVCSFVTSRHFRQAADLFQTILCLLCLMSCFVASWTRVCCHSFFRPNSVIAFSHQLRMFLAANFFVLVVFSFLCLVFVFGAVYLLMFSQHAF